MKKWKQALALVLALVMALSLVALPSFAADEDASGSGTAASDGPAWPAEGSINLSKKAQPVDEESGLYEVTLTIQGKNYSTTSDVVLVIDCSGSMEGTKLTNTRKAAKAFGDKLLTENSTTRIAIVTFIDTATAYNSGHFYTASELDAFKKAIDKATYANGGTNQQAGIHVAQQLLASASSTGKQKNIVILSDGEPTYSHPFVATATYANCEAWTEIGCPRGGNITNIGAFTPDYNTVIGSGGAFTTSYNAYVNATCTEHGKTSRLSYGVYALDGTVTRTSGTNNGVATIWEANQAKTAGTTIFSVALQAGTEGENTLKGCASDAAKGYFAIANNDNVETKLTAAFETIAGSIAKAATNGSVTDPMSQYVNLAFTGDPKVTNSLDEYNAGGYDVYLSQGTVTRSGETLNWNVGDINEGTPAVMKYRVTLKDGLSKDRTYPTNDTTTFNYTDYQDQETSKDFEIPQVAPKGGTILMHFYLVNAQGQPINEKGVEVESPDKAKQLAAQEYYQMNGSQALEYDTYNVPMKEISGAAYYGYTLDGVTTKDVTEASVTVSTTNANREVWFAYYQTFNVVHVRMNDAGAAQQVGEIDTYPVSSDFDLTDKVNKDKDGNAVTEGTFLYGGAFQNAACTTAYPFAEGETGKSFTPTPGETYYIWEVPNTYLIPKTLDCWEHNTEGQLDVIGYYMLSVIDREVYKEVGFYVNDVRTPANQRTYKAIDEDRGTTVVNLPEGQSVAFEGITINLKQEDQSDSYTPSDLVPADKYGYMLCYGLDKNTYWSEAGKAVSYYPYWVTLDGVEVTNNVTRVGTYQGVGHDRIQTANESRTAGCTVPAAAETQLLTMAFYCADGTPITADVPTVEDVTVTVVDGSNTTQVKVAPNGSVRDQVAYQAPAGKVFAGWFADQAYTIPADLDQVTEDTTIYAKYVSDSYLDLHYVRNGLFRLRGVTLISAVDNPANYQESGIIVDGVKVPVAYANRYRLFYTASGLFGAARNAKLMITQQSLSGSGTLEVTPYWVTLDGTEVHGVTHTLHYNTRTIWE